MMTKSHWLVALVTAVISVIATLSIVYWPPVAKFSRHSSIPPSLNVRNVAEPIKFLDAELSDFDWSWTISFKDARGIDWVFHVELGAGGRVIVHRGNRDRAMPMRGTEEKILLGILERWVKGDPEASEINKKAEVWWDVDGVEHGVAIYRELLERNQ